MPRQVQSKYLVVYTTKQRAGSGLKALPPKCFVTRATYTKSWEFCRGALMPLTMFRKACNTQTFCTSATPANPPTDRFERRQKDRGPTKSAHFHSPESFQELGLSQQLETALHASGIKRPSHIQSLSIKAFADQKGHLLIADHAGSGKTLAYLIPMMTYLRASELSSGARFARAQSPAAIILAPTQELCSQVRAVAKQVASSGMPFSIKLMTGGIKGKRTQRQALEAAPDIVIGTPARLSELLAAGLLHLTCCRVLVLDEVDILGSHASLFHDEVARLLKAAPANMRALLVTASLSQAAWMELQSDFPGLKPVLGPGLHRPAPGSTEQLIDCSGGEEFNEETAYQRKATAMLQVLEDKPVQHSIIFCNKLVTCRKVENTLKRALKTRALVLPYHAGIDAQQRQNNVTAFLREGDDRKILVCTDRASRGLDTTTAEHVIMFDFPRDPSEYLRRAGRTARGARGVGMVSLLVLGRQVKLAKQILHRNVTGQPLHQMPMA